MVNTCLSSIRGVTLEGGCRGALVTKGAQPELPGVVAIDRLTVAGGGISLAHIPCIATIQPYPLKSQPWEMSDVEKQQ
jgi:hypothetical protein